jgi:hypothetical protein
MSARPRTPIEIIAHESERAGAHLPIAEQDVETSSAAGGGFFGLPPVFTRFRPACGGREG